MIDKVMNLNTKYDIQLLLDYIKLAADTIEDVVRMTGMSVTEVTSGLCSIVERGAHHDNSVFA